MKPKTLLVALLTFVLSFALIAPVVAHTTSGFSHTSTRSFHKATVNWRCVSRNPQVRSVYKNHRFSTPDTVRHKLAKTNGATYTKHWEVPGNSTWSMTTTFRIGGAWINYIYSWGMDYSSSDRHTSTRLGGCG